MKRGTLIPKMLFSCTGRQKGGMGEKSGTQLQTQLTYTKVYRDVHLNINGLLFRLLPEIRQN